MPRTLLLPAVVEAEPARTVKVLPPVAGRVVELKVELGSRVVKDQALAVIDSGDLAQAYSDEEKAQAMVTLTKKALDRLAELEKTRAIAVKDREEAQNDYAQALSERDRAETRLRSIGVSPEPLEKTRLLSLKAPVTGSVTDLQIATGAFLNDPTAALMTIADLDTSGSPPTFRRRTPSLVTNGQAGRRRLHRLSGRDLQAARCCSSATCSIPTRGAPRCASRSTIPTGGSSRTCSPPPLSWPPERPAGGADHGAAAEERQRPGLCRDRALDVRARARSRSPSSRAIRPSVTRAAQGRRARRRQGRGAAQ